MGFGSQREQGKGDKRMKKKLIIYLLAAVMVLSPAAVFADTAADAVSDDAAVTELEQVSADAMTFNGNYECYWVENSGRTRAEATKGSGVYATGLFKAERVIGKLGLYYADGNGLVVQKEGPVTVSTGEKYIYTKVAGETGWSLTGGGPYTYLIKTIMVIFMPSMS